MRAAFFSNEEETLVVEAIKRAELNTSGEVRVHLENRCDIDVLDRAAYWFKKLDMHKTEQRNGILFYLAYESKKFAVLGDAGINSKVGNEFWDTIRQKIELQFKEGHFAQGLVDGITSCGEQLKTYFPYQVDDVNELPDEISYSKR